MSAPPVYSGAASVPASAPAASSAASRVHPLPKVLPRGPPAFLPEGVGYRRFSTKAMKLKYKDMPLHDRKNLLSMADKGRKALEQLHTTVANAARDYTQVRDAVSGQIDSIYGETLTLMKTYALSKFQDREYPYAQSPALPARLEETDSLNDKLLKVRALTLFMDHINTASTYAFMPPPSMKELAERKVKVCPIHPPRPPFVPPPMASAIDGDLKDGELESDAARPEFQSPPPHRFRHRPGRGVVPPPVQRIRFKTTEKKEKEKKRKEKKRSREEAVDLPRKTQRQAEACVSMIKVPPGGVEVVIGPDGVNVSDIPDSEAPPKVDGDSITF